MQRFYHFNRKLKIFNNETKIYIPYDIICLRVRRVEHGHMNLGHRQRLARCVHSYTIRMYRLPSTLYLRLRVLQRVSCLPARVTPRSFLLAGCFRCRITKLWGHFKNEKRIQAFPIFSCWLSQRQNRNLSLSSSRWLLNQRHSAFGMLCLHGKKHDILVSYIPNMLTKWSDNYIFIFINCKRWFSSDRVEKFKTVINKLKKNHMP